MEKQDSKADVVQLDNATHKYDMWAKFSEDQKYLFNSFKEKITAMTGITEPVKNWLSDMTLWRYLRARKWNLKKSESMLTESIEWRQEYKPHEITRDEVVGVLELKTLYRNGKDLNRNPLLVITPGGENPYSVEKRVKALVYTIEECIESMEEKEHGVEKISIICDFSDYGSRARSPDGMKVMKQSIHILQNHYPERLGRAMIVNPPWFFHMLYKIASPWLDPVTKSKIYWIKGDKESLRKQMSEFIDPSQLEVRFGGDREKTIEPDLLEMKRQSMNNMNNVNINNTSTSNTTTEKSVSEKELQHEDSKKSVKSTHSHEKSEENHKHKHDKHDNKEKDNKEKEKHKKSHSKAKLKESNKKNSKTDVSNANE